MALSGAHAGGGGGTRARGGWAVQCRAWMGRVAAVHLQSMKEGSLESVYA